MNNPATDDSGDGAAAEQQPQHAVEDTKKKQDAKTLWVTVFKCFYCGKHGHNLPKCRQCS